MTATMACASGVTLVVFSEANGVEDGIESGETQKGRSKEVKN
jgi:hypothetical protein